MENNTLMMSQKNAVFQIISKDSLNPNDFTWKEDGYNLDAARISVLFYKDNQDYYYAFGLNQCEFSPGEHVRTVVVPIVSWSHQLLVFRRWLDFLKREINQDDLWSMYGGTQTEQNEIPEVKFNEKELALIESKLAEFKKAIVEHVIPGQLNSVHERLDYLAESSKKQDKRSWFHLAIGIFVTIVTSMNATSRQVLWSQFASILNIVYSDSIAWIKNIAALR